MTLRIRTHKVARTAYACVDARKAEHWNKQYGTLAHRLPGMVLQNGLAQTTGFLLAKGGDEHAALLDDLCHVLRDAGVTDAVNGPALHKRVISSDLAAHMRLTRHALDVSGWLKRYAQGVLGVDPASDP